jgi:hypothetical protein
MKNFNTFAMKIDLKMMFHSVNFNYYYHVAYYLKRGGHISY